MAFAFYGSRVEHQPLSFLLWYRCLIKGIYSCSVSFQMIPKYILPFLNQISKPDYILVLATVSKPSKCSNNEQEFTWIARRLFCIRLQPRIDFNLRITISFLKFILESQYQQAVHLNVVILRIISALITRKTEIRREVSG